MSDLIEREKAVVQPDHETIRMLAYDFWCSRGCLEGSPEIDWFAAEKQLTGESPTLAELAPLAALSQGKVRNRH